MQFLFELFPLLLFVGAYLLKDIYFALGVLMVAMPIGFLLKYVKTRKLDKMYLWSTVFLLVAGAATFYFRNPKFLYWKPTVFYWAAAIAFVGSLWIGEKPLVRKIFDMAGDEIPTNRINDREWVGLNLVWALFLVLLGVANIYVAYNYPEEFWVKFKLGLFGAMFVFTLVQSIWIVFKLGLTDDDVEPEGK